jgi:cellulose synthase (UDP-forming)
MALGRFVLGAPSQPFANGSVLDAGPQTPWGKWWDRHPRLLRGLALVALAWMAAYLTWRVGWSGRGSSPVLWLALLLAEAYGLWNLTMLTWIGWRRTPSVRPAATPGHQVDVYVCTYDEPVSVLRATLAGCAALTYPHTTYLLDDGRREEMAALAGEWGATYVTRPDNSHAKAGNVNHALRRTAGDLVFVLDADHVPLPDALDALVGYFDDPGLALVQTPHDFYNHDSIQHYEVGRHEQSVFYSVICPGKDRHGAAFWCGTGGLIRRQALLAVGGVATETIAEDFHTTLKLQRAGWTSRYHDEIVAYGLAPHDLAAYLLQRDRWARGNLAVFTTPESPLRARELSARQRLSYFASLTAYLAGPVRLLMLAVLAAVLLTGELPLHATALSLALLWAPSTILALAAGSALCRGYQRVSDTTHFELCTAEIYLRALRCIVRPGRASFAVTPKGSVDLGGWAAMRQLRVVLLVAVVLGAGLVLRLVDAVGPDVMPDFHGMGAWLVPLLALVELRRVLRTLAFVARRRQLRVEYRMPIDAPAVIHLPQGGQTITGRARDLCPSGVGLRLPASVAPAGRAVARLELRDLAGDPVEVTLELEITACRRGEGGWLVGSRLVSCDADAERRILEQCYIVSQRERARADHPVRLPAPVAPRVPDRAPARAYPAFAGQAA